MKPRKYCGLELLMRAERDFQDAKGNYEKMNKFIDTWNVMWVEEVNTPKPPKTR